MTMPGMPGEGWPESEYAVPVNVGESAPAGVADWASTTEDEWRQSQVRDPVMGSFAGVAGFRGFLMNALMGLVAGPLQFISDLLSLRWAQVDDHEETIVDLQDKTQELLDVVGYGCSYMNTTTSTDFKGTKKKMAFSTQVGRLVGCTMDGYGYVLGSKGLWRADLQMTFDVYAIGVKDLDMDIRVYAPDGSLYDQQLFPDSTGSRAARTNVYSFIVPSAGYKVYAYAQCALGRKMLGGNGRSGFYVTKISGETN